VCVIALRGFSQLVDNVLRGRLVRISHTKIDDILSPRTSGCLQLIDNIEDIRRQTLDSWKIVHGEVVW